MPIVPLSSDHIASQAGFFEPQRVNHYKATFFLPNIVDQNMISLSIVAGSLPQEANEVIVMAHKNEKVKVAGSFTLDDFSFKVRDFCTNNTYGALRRWRRLVYNEITGAVGFAAAYKVRGLIELTSPDGLTISRLWELRGCWPNKLNPPGLADNSNDVMEIDMGISVDKAVSLFT